MSGRSVLAGLEFPDFDAPAFAAWMASDGGADAIARFLQDSSWTGVTEAAPDGRTSIGMFRMIDDLRQMRAAGMDIDIVPFVRPATEDMASQTPYEAGLAETLGTAIAERRPDVTLVLVGNLHALKQDDAEAAAAPMVPMAAHLPANEVFSLSAVGQGETWSCVSADRDSPPVCGAHRMSSVMGSGQEASLTRQRITGFGHYDGALWRGEFSASPPMRSADDLN